MDHTTFGAETTGRSHPLRRFVAVSGEPAQAELLDVLSADDHDYGVIFVDTIGRSYLRIKQVIPDVVIVYCAIDDLAACQLLSMLKLDEETRSIPVLTYTAGYESQEEEAEEEDDADSGTMSIFSPAPGMRIN